MVRLNRTAHGLTPEQEGSIVQTSRVLASVLPFDDDAILMTGDADMVPLNAQYFDGYDRNYKMRVFNAFATIQNLEYPICYIHAPAGLWRQILNVTVVCYDANFANI